MKPFDWAYAMWRRTGKVKEVSMGRKVQVFEGKNGQWFYRRVSTENHATTVTGGEGFVSKENAERAAHTEFPVDEVEVLAPDDPGDLNNPTVNDDPSLD